MSNDNNNDNKEKFEYGTTMFDRMFPRSAFSHWEGTAKAIRTACEPKQNTLEDKSKSAIDKLLDINEQVLLTADQSRIMPGGSLSTPDSIHVTNRRIIFKNPRWLGTKIDIMDFMYRDLANAELHEGWLSTEIILTIRFNGEKIKLPAVSKSVADELFGIIRKGIAGDLGFGSDGQVIVQQQQQQPNDAVTKLEKLSALKEKGMISDAEYDAAKTRLLGEL
jgi:hypothetical protein